MKGQKIGYVRVSSLDQNPDRQLENMEVDKLFVDKCSGKNIDRPQFKIMMDYLRENDTLVVYSLDRLARNLDHLRQIVKQLVSQNIRVQFIKENLIFTGDDSPIAVLLLSVMGAFAEFERKLIRERQSEGIRAALAKGKKVGRPVAFSQEEWKEVKERIEKGESKSKIIKEFGVGRSTFYKYLKNNYINEP